MARKPLSTEKRRLIEIEQEKRALKRRKEMQLDPNFSNFEARGNERDLPMFKEFAETFLKVKRKGMDNIFARKYCGIPNTTFFQFKDYAKFSEAYGDLDCPYLKFFKEVDRLDAERYDKLYQTIVKAGEESDWKASAFILKKRVKAFKDKHNYLEQKGLPADIIEDITSDERLERLAKLLKL